jgi:hypothetical protein
MITENKFNNEEFHIKLKQRQKYVKTIDKLQASNRALSNSNANLQWKEKTTFCNLTPVKFSWIIFQSGKTWKSYLVAATVYTFKNA